MAPTATLLATALLSGALLPPSSAPGQVSPRLITLPDNPCDLLTREQLAAITRLDITAVQRVPSISKIVEAQRENREPDPGTICSYETRSAFAAISVFVPPRAIRTTDTYWAARSKYLETYPGSGRPIPDVGIDAWLAGGADLHVLVRQNEYFTLSTQMYQKQSRELLINIARAVLARF
jgi:hypothetical protein